MTVSNEAECGKNAGINDQAFQILFDAISEAAFWFDALTCRLLRCNRSAEALLARPCQDAVGRSPAELFPAEITACFENACAAGEPTASEVVLLAPGGVKTPALLKMLRKRVGDQEILLVLIDIDKGRPAEENVDFRARKLDSLGVLAAGIAHNFNNILTGILGNLSFARLFLEESHRCTQPLEQAEKATLRAAELAAQLVTFASGGVPVKKEVVVGALVQESVKRALQGTSVRGVVKVATPLALVEADEAQLTQVFGNIVVNAVQAMPDGGVLEVLAEQITLTPGNRFALPPGGYVSVTFADEGHGIAEPHRDKVFDPCFSTKPGSPGLGLSSAHSIVNRHGGYIHLSSELGRGTAVTVYLPALVSPAAPERVGTEPLVDVSHHGGTVLVMDDEEMIRMLACSMLEYLGYEVATCVDGEQALEMYKQAKLSGSPYYATIMDLTIPGGMGGKEAAQEILQFDPTARLIVSSGYSNDPVIAHYSSHGFRGAITKPYRIDDMARTMASLAGAPDGVMRGE